MEEIDALICEDGKDLFIGTLGVIVLTTPATGSVVYKSL